MSHYEYQIYLPPWLGQALAREADEAGLSVRQLLQQILTERYAKTGKPVERRAPCRS